LNSNRAEPAKIYMPAASPDDGVRYRVYGTS
jgi:hypothetical protein